MNIFKFELKNNLKAVIIWIISMICIVTVFSLMFTVYKNSEPDVIKILKNYPPQALELLGIDVKTIFSYNGFFAFTSTYILLAGSIMSVFFGLTIFGREKTTKTSDFLLSKPKKRTRIFLEKYSAAITCLLIINIFFYIISFLMFFIRGAGSDLYSYTLIIFSISFVEIIFLSIGIFIANILKKIKNPGGISTTTSFAFFIVYMMQGILKEDKLQYLSPFGYFKGQYIIQNNTYDIKFIFVSLLLVIFLTVFSYISFIRSDIETN